MFFETVSRGNSLSQCKMILRVFIFFSSLYFVVAQVAAGRPAFEKLTELDYRGSTYYTIRNLSLWECQGWCREEPECAAASFSFVLNPLAPVQETLCLLQNETLASNPSAQPQRAVSLYYMVKLAVKTDNVCNRPWTFERVPNKKIKGLDNALIFTSTKEACLAACLNEKRFTCRSCEYNYVMLQCHLSEHDRRSVGEEVELVDAAGIDYFENLCLGASQSCKGERDYKEPLIGVPADRISHYVDLQYYVDKELMANSAAACKRACEIELEFLCRSFLYKGPATGSAYNCQLFHLDHYTLPDGPSTYLSTDRPLLDSGEKSGTYYENVCKQLGGSGSLTTVDASGSSGGNVITAGGGNGLIAGGVGGIGGSGGSSSSGSSSSGSSSSASSSSGSSSSGSSSSGSAGGLLGGIAGGITGGSSGGAGGSITGGAGGSAFTTLAPGGAGAAGDNVNCDPTGVCYDVSVHCKDTRIVVQVATTRAFNGRIYALGRSETCNVDVISSDKFRLDLTMEGQDCNTQSVNGVYTNTVVIQHHSVVMTKTDKIYKVRCTYDMSSKNITFGMMPISQHPDGMGNDISDMLLIGDPDMIPITSAPEAPPPRIRILDATLKEVETVRIGDRLTFRIEIPEETPYGIFARSCVAMAKDSRSTFQIIDDDGCPVEPAIFPHFTQDGAALQAVYEAFRFTESYGVIFQCNVKYCLGECQAAKCRTGTTVVRSFGRRRRGLRDASQQSIQGNVQETTKEEALAAAKGLETSNKKSDEEMSISQEILVLDLGDEQSPQYKKTSEQSSKENYFTNSTFNFDHPEVTLYETCPTRSSVLALAVTCAILLLIYVLTVFYFVMRKWMSPPKRMR